MKKWRCVGFAGYLVLLLATSANGQSYARVGVTAFADYNLPVLSLRDGWYTKSAKWGGGLLYSVDKKLTMEFEYHRVAYHDGKIEARKFNWSVDKKDYTSPQAAADMVINSGLINAQFRMGDPTNLFRSPTSSFYVLFGAGYYSYANKVQGLIYPGQTTAPLDTNLLLQPDKDTRTALGVNFGFGLEHFLSKSFSLDFRIRHSFILGQLKPEEAWGVKETWPMQMIDIGLALKIYGPGR